MKSKFYFLLALFFVLFLIPFRLPSLERDFVYRANGKNFWSNEACINLLGQNMLLPTHLDLNVVPILKKHQKATGKCSGCDKPTELYAGYFLFRYKKGYPFLNNQIAYTKKYPNIQAYWPETSEKAEAINSIAVRLFKNLFSTTEISKPCAPIHLSRDFPTDSANITVENFYPFIPISLASQCFRFSDYYVVCQDIEDFAKKHRKNYFSEKSYTKIVDSLSDILATLAPLFEEVYLESLSLHPTEEIKMELFFLQNLARKGHKFSLKQRDFCVAERAVLDDIDEYFAVFNVEQNLSKYEMLLSLGTALNESYLYWDAIATLNQAIGLDKSRKEAYVERAYAYFELGQVNEALKDLSKVKSLNKKQKKNLRLELLEEDECYEELFAAATWDIDEDLRVLYPKGLSDNYLVGFCVGLQRGAVEGLIDYIPNTLSCCSGILHGIWSFSKNPKEASKKVFEICHALTEQIRKNSLRENLELVVPELKELCEGWDSFNYYDRGDRIGYIIGRYGIEIFAPLITIKTAKYFLALKRANTVATLNACASKVDSVAVLEKSAQHAKLRQALWESAKKGRVIAQDGNKIPHVMQKKHAWDRLINLTGNQVEDFSKVIALLEENNILKNVKTAETTTKGLKIIRCEMVIQENIVEAHFVEYSTKEIFLTNAYVKTR